MANKKITELASATTPLAGTELLEIVQSGVNKKVAVSDVGGGTTPDLEAVLTEGDESTTQDAIFRLDADKYLKINRADQSFEIWDLSVDADEPMSYVKGNIVKIGNSSTDYTISLDGDGGSISILDNGTADETFFTRAVINKNGINYQYPDGETSMLAKTAISKTGSFTAQNDTAYTSNGTITVTDPTGVTNKGYIVHVIGGTSTIGGVGYTTGALVYRFYNGSTWASVDMNGSGGVSDGDKGDITVSGSGTVWTIDNGAVTPAKTTGIQESLTETNFGLFANGLTAKTTPLDADLINIVDTADSNKQKKVTFTNVKAFLKTYFDTLYATVASLLGYVKFIAKTSTPVTVTGTTAKTEVYQVTIPANTLGANDVLDLDIVTTKSS